jgi:Flp pilus assembly protein CpaB
MGRVVMGRVVMGREYARTVHHGLAGQVRRRARRRRRPSVPTIAWWTIAALAAGLLVQRVSADLAELDRRARAGGAPVEVVVVRSDVMLGERVTADDLTTIDVPTDMVPPDAILEPARAIGNVATVAILADTVLTARHVADADREGSAWLVGPSQRLVRVIVEAGVRPRPGDVVDLLAPAASSDLLAHQGTKPEPAVVVLSGVVVVAVDDDEGPVTGVGGVGRLGVSVLTSPEDAARLVGAAASHALVAVLAPPEAAAGDAAPASVTREGPGTAPGRGALANVME